MKIEVNITKRYFFAILATVLILTSALGVVAYNAGGSGGVPSNFGHSSDEVDGITHKGVSKSLQVTVNDIDTEVTGIDDRLTVEEGKPAPSGGFSEFKADFPIGSTDWPVPNGASIIKIQAWGAGGGGGGGGGGYGEGIFNVVSGTYTINVGKGGAGGCAACARAGNPSVVKDPSGSEIVRADGGSEGASLTPGLGGGSSSSGVNLVGSQFISIQGGRGSSGGDSPKGGSGGGASGLSGVVPGGGGAKMSGVSSGSSHGAGANGQVIIWW